MTTKEARLKALLEACKLVEEEPELPGTPPPGYEELVLKVGIVTAQRSLIRLTKDKIIERIQNAMKE